MSIIIEGPDNSGKTNLGERLAKDLKIHYVHSIKPNSFADHNEIVEHAINQIKPGLRVQDRCYAISEYVYSRALSRGQVLSDMDYQKILLELYFSRSILIYCRPDDLVILDNSRPQMKGVEDNFREIISEYDNLLSEVKRFGHIKVIDYDWTKGKYESLLATCQSYMDEVMEAMTSSLYYTQYRSQK